MTNNENPALGKLVRFLIAFILLLAPRTAESERKSNKKFNIGKSIRNELRLTREELSSTVNAFGGGEVVIRRTVLQQDKNSEN